MLLTRQSVKKDTIKNELNLTGTSVSFDNISLTIDESSDSTISEEVPCILGGVDVTLSVKSDFDVGISVELARVISTFDLLGG